MMFRSNTLLSTLVSLLSACSTAYGLGARASNDATLVCQLIGTKISNASAVIYPLDIFTYESDIHHWYNTSTQNPACVVEVGSANDTSTVMSIVGSTRTPFAVRSGGHASNPGFSSTTGVHIALTRFNQVQLSADNSTVEIGMGLTWADVYKDLQGTGYNVVGGRTAGPGVGGFTLGGGFSWKTNQHGLTCDTVKSFNLVLPGGRITTVDSSQPDLFFALRGGLNRFGVVTSAVYYTHEQPAEVYAGVALYGTTEVDAVLAATATFFQENTDPKAQVITTLSGSTTGTSNLVLFFYDGPTRPASFAPFNNITATVSTVGTTTFSAFVSEVDSSLISNARGTFNTLSTAKLTPTFLAAVKNETDYYGSVMALHSGTSISYDVEPFLTSYGSYATDSAYPHSDSPLPLNLYFAWTDASDDAFWYAAMRQSIATLKNVAISEGIYKDDFTAYPNYAISNTTAQALYGSTNAQRLHSIKAAVDPTGIMELAGGFTI